MVDVANAVLVVWVGVSVASVELMAGSEVLTASEAVDSASDAADEDEASVLVVGALLEPDGL